MIDTIHLAYKFSKPSERAICLEILKDRYSVETLYKVTNDNFKKPVEVNSCKELNFKIWLWDDSIHIQGSLTKLYFGNNIDQMNYDQMVKAYNLLLCNFDFIDWNKAMHKRIDIGVSFLMSNSPSLYVNKMIGGKSMQKHIFSSNSDSTVIKNDSHQIIFYDKTAEFKKVSKLKTLTCPDNLLRIEYKIFKEYPMVKCFGTKDVTIKHIVNNADLLPKIWYKMYRLVEKDYEVSNSLFCNQKEMEVRALQRYGLEQLKSEAIASYKAGLMSSSTKQNILKYLRTIYEVNNKGLSSVNLICELDEKVKCFMNNNTFTQQVC